MPFPDSPVSLKARELEKFKSFANIPTRLFLLIKITEALTKHPLQGSAAEIARDLHCSVPSVGPAAHRLIRLGLITRRRLGKNSRHWEYASVEFVKMEHMVADLRAKFSKGKSQ